MNKSNIGIITFPIAVNGRIPLSNLVEIIYKLSDNLYIITGNEGYDCFKFDARVKVFSVDHKSGFSLLSRICRYFYTNLNISYNIFKLRTKVNVWIFFIGGDALLLPMLTAKVLKKNCILSLASSASLVLKYSGDRFCHFVKILSFMNFRLANKIVLHSDKLISEWGMETFNKKIFIAHEYFLDFDKFYLNTEYKDRNNCIGYIGTLAKVKGVLNYIEAVSLIIGKVDNLQFSLAGDGNLLSTIFCQLRKNNLGNNLKYVGWIPHDKLPEHLNSLKLIVIPSYTESGPIVALEAMACGTPILATRVGHILNLIEDGENGFIMENNSPECIAENIIRVLNYPNLDQVIINAKDLVRQKFSYEAAVNSYKGILEFEASR